jgi:cytochrome c biogenesis protein
MQLFSLNRVIKKLANLQLAIGLLFTIGIIIAFGTVIEQNQNINFYQQNYPEANPLFGWLTWKLILSLELNNIYTAYWFLIILVIFGASLLACTLSVQLPALRRFRRWKFYTNTTKVKGFEQTLLLHRTNGLPYHLHGAKYHIYRQGRKNYAYSGLLGRAGPIVVHASLILLLIGSSIGAGTGYIGQEIIPRGEIFHIQNLIKIGTLSTIPQNLAWRVNDFWITYTVESKTNQFYSDLSLLDTFGNEIKRKIIFVNEPFVYKGITVYQTDWDILGVKIIQNNGEPLQVSLKKVIKNGRKFWLGSLQTFQEQSSFSILLNDLNNQIYLYDSTGTLIRVGKLGETFPLNSKEYITFTEFLTSTGLQIKTDPGLRTVYLAFFFLIISAYASFISYSQIWSVEDKTKLKLTGNSNRAVLFFQTELRKIINKTALNF